VRLYTFWPKNEKMQKLWCKKCKHFSVKNPRARHGGLGDGKRYTSARKSQKINIDKYNKI